MDFRTIKNKLVIGDKLRMTQPTLLFEDNTPAIAEHIVEADETCRIDLISLKFYRSHNYVDYILKFNGISNPFTIKEGDVLMIPSNATILKKFKPIKEVGESDRIENAVRDQFIDTKRLPAKDANRVEYLKRKAALKKNGSKEILPPNVLKTDETNIDISGGTITI